jgi:hypothetical protein
MGAYIVKRLAGRHYEKDSPHRQWQAASTGLGGGWLRSDVDRVCISQADSREKALPDGQDLLESGVRGRLAWWGI